MERGRYTIYSKHKSFKRARFVGVSTNDFEEAKSMVDHLKEARYASLIYDWFKVKDTVTNKYVYEG